MKSRSGRLAASPSSVPSPVGGSRIAGTARGIRTGVHNTICTRDQSFFTSPHGSSSRTSRNNPHCRRGQAIRGVGLTVLESALVRFIHSQRLIFMSPERQALRFHSLELRLLA